MSLVDLRVELPSFSQSFQVQVPESASVLDIKEAIKIKCPGNPSVDGQKLIWRGRFLKDTERLSEVWKSPNESRVVHLAVHPSAWTSGMPSTSTPDQSSSTPAPTPLSTQRLQPSSSTVRPPPYPQPVAGGLPLPYIVAKHRAALQVLITGQLPQEPNSSLLSSQRQYAVSVLNSYGWSWPRILDEDYPPADSSNPGLRYEQVMIDNYPYLSLTSPTATPTPCQSHALKVLTHTFAMLAIPYPDPLVMPHYPAYTPIPAATGTNLNEHLRQLGLPPLRLNVNNANQNPNDPNNALAAAEIRAIPLRALMMPLMMLTFRTLILMYFFSPSKRPLFGLILSAWILYEAWGAFRAVLGGDNPGDGAARAGGVNAGARGGPQNGAHPVALAVNPNQPTGRSYINLVLDKLAGMQLNSEDRSLHGSNGPEPSLLHKATTFLSLLVVTLHPAIWDRRRAALRRREGLVRTEANVRDTPDPEVEGDDAGNAARARARTLLQERYDRKPRWVKEYIQRVLHTEWVDES
ncbi:Homocysteine-responsive endoplasmic reticulum-resident ubiquitin-like domain member 1 /2 [Abortiporus biennis]